MSIRRYEMDDLLFLMARLRDSTDGCPWDRRQSFKTIVPHTLEETYEVVDAIERKDWSHLGEELGDLLFQVVFYAQLGQEAGHFDFQEVVQGIVEKLLRRHPHVFPDGTLESRLAPGQVIAEAEIAGRWEAIKAEEKRLKQKAQPIGSAPEKQAPVGSLLNDVPNAMPAHQRAEKLQKKAARVGFDWPEITPVFAKLREELDELQAELEKNSIEPDRLRDEMGDVLFCAINLARNAGVGADDALRTANRKFERRFSYIEEALRQQGRLPEEASLEEMDALWDEAKAQGL